MSYQGDAYDPSAPEGDLSGRSQYISKKDFRIIAIGVAALGVMLWPLYQYGKRQSEAVRCKANMGAIFKAIELYAVEKDDRLPPITRTQADGVTPLLGPGGLPYTWASDVMQYMSARHSFTCPAATKEEITKTEHPTDAERTLDLTYGFYAPYGAALRSAIPNRSQVLLIGETSNFGSQGSFNPMPFLNPDGSKIQNDGFVIGWNDSNAAPSDQTNAVTRLAFRNTASGSFLENGPARHDAGLHFINGDGALVTLKPDVANVTLSQGFPTGAWQTPPTVRRR
jgi:hypothetical protein